MQKFKINDGCYLNSSGVSLRGNTVYTPKDEAEEEDLLKLQEQGTCKVMGAPVEQPAPAPVEPKPAASDLADVPGLGKTSLEKLAKSGVTTKAQLKEAILAKPEDMKAVLGLNFQKVSDHLNPPSA